MNKEFNKGLLLAGFGSFWWGFFGVIYFKYIAYIGHIELVVHRCLWTAFTLILTTFFFSKWNIFFKIVKNKSNLFYLFISGFLIFINWGVWIYAIATNRIIDASFGYFIMPILSVMLGYLFFKEKLNKKRVFSILLVILSILFLIIVSIKSLPWVGLIVALSWGFYNLVRKKINVDTDVGLLIESLFILPFALLAFYLIASKGYNDFQLSDPSMMLFIYLEIMQMVNIFFSTGKIPVRYPLYIGMFALARHISFEEITGIDSLYLSASVALLAVALVALAYRDKLIDKKGPELPGADG